MRVIARTLRGLGWELKRAQRSLAVLSAESAKSTAGSILEIVGTQGVGKTTLNDRVYHAIRDRWFARGDVDFKGPSEVGCGQIESLHRDLYFQKVERIRQERHDPWKTVTLARQMSAIAFESLMISTQKYPRGFLLDEGLFKNFPDEVMEVGAEEAMPLWSSRAFVHLRASDPTVAAERYTKRVAQRRESGAAQHEYSAAEVVARVESDTATYDRMCAQAERLGRPVLVLDASQSIDASVESMLAFESSLARSASPSG